MLQLLKSEKKNILVTGGAGFIGSHFVELALKLGHSVIVLDALTYAGHLENLIFATSNSQFKFVEASISNAALVSELLKNEKINWLVNFAAESHVDRSISGPQAFIDTNINGVFHLLNTAFKYWENLPNADRSSFRFLQVSTDEVFGSLGAEGFFSEVTAYAPNSPYSASKAAADHLVRAWHHTYGLPTLITNCSNNYGARQFPEKLIPTVITRAIKGEQIPIYGTGLNIRDWIHVKDHCNGIMAALCIAKPGSAYCFGGNAESTNLDLAKTICKFLDKHNPKTAPSEGHASLIALVEDRKGHDQRYAIDDHKATRDLGFTRSYSLMTGMEDTVLWYLQNEVWLRILAGKLKKQ